MKLNTFAKLALALAMVVMGSSATLASTTGTADLTVDATVTADCIMSVTDPINFSSFSTLGVDPLATDTATVSVACTNGTTAKIHSATTRQLDCAGSSTLSFEMYTDAGYTTALSSDGTGNTVDITGDGSAHSQTIYAKVPKSGNDSVKAGACTQGTMVLSIVY